MDAERKSRTQTNTSSTTIFSMATIIGINNVGSHLWHGCRGNRDIRGPIPTPKYIISPWLNSSIEPDISPPSRISGVNIARSNLRHGGHDIRGLIPNPKVNTAPWLTSSIESEKTDDWFDI